jgi:hypothetical protein
MEAQWIRDRALLRSLMSQYPQWSNPQDAQTTGRSVSWVKQWRVRLKQAPRDDMLVLLSRSRAHHAPSHRWDLPVIQRLGEMRQQPPEHLQRVPGPRTLVYYLQRDPYLQELGVEVPRSCRTVWKLLRQHGYILPRVPRQHEPLEPREPLEEVQIDRYRTPPPLPWIPAGKANDNMWSKSVILSMPGPRSSFLLRPTMPFGRRRPLRRSWRSYASLAGHACSPSIATRGFGWQ